MLGFDHATIPIPIFHGLRQERQAQWLPFRVINTKKNALKIMSPAAYGRETNNKKVICICFLYTDKVRLDKFSYN